MLGTVVNSAAIIVGALIGIFLRKGIPMKYRTTIMQGIGLSVALIGIKMALKTNNELIVIISMVIGGAIGELLNIQGMLEKMGQKINSLISKKDVDFVKGFVTTTLIFCVGAMSILGALESGITGNHKILFAKSVLDGVSSVIFASTFGWGVVFSSFSVFLYQGTLTLLAGLVKGFLTEAVLAEVTATGGLLILGIAANVLEIKEIKVANLLPALLIAAIISNMLITLT